MNTRHLFTKLALLSIPYIVIAGLLIGFTTFIGEAMPTEFAVWQMSQYPSMIYGPRFGRDMFAFNLTTVNQRRPTILAIGSSRSWLIRSEFFTAPDASFYNASEANWTLNQIDPFVRQLSAEAQPKILLLGIDKPWFNPNFVPLQVQGDGAASPSRLTGIIRATLAFVLSHPSRLADLLNRRNPVTGDFALGIDGIITGVGIRHDGSLLHGQVIQGLAPIQDMLKQHLQSLTDGTKMFVAGNQISARSISQLDDFLSYAEDNGIEVIGFAPPFAPSIYAGLVADGKHDYIWKLDPVLSDVFASHGFQYFNFTDPASVEAKEADFSDGWHTSELITVRMIVNMLRASTSLSQYSDLNYLETVITNAKNTFDIFSEY